MIICTELHSERAYRATFKKNLNALAFAFSVSKDLERSSVQKYIANERSEQRLKEFKSTGVCVLCFKRYRMIICTEIHIERAFRATFKKNLNALAFSFSVSKDLELSSVQKYISNERSEQRLKRI